MADLEIAHETIEVFVEEGRFKARVDGQVLTAEGCDWWEIGGISPRLVGDGEQKRVLFAWDIE